MAQQRDLSNWELAALACLLEGGGTRSVDTEDLAVRAYSLAPKRFCWRRYPERVDLDAVRVALTDAAKPKNGGLVLGSKDQGWRLTSSGLEFANNVCAERAELAGDTAAVLASGRRHVAASVAREAANLRESAAFAKWSTGRAAQITVYDFFEATRTAEYLPEREMARRRKHLESLLSGDEELAAFVRFLFDKYSSSYRSSETE